MQNTSNIKTAKLIRLKVTLVVTKNTAYKKHSAQSKTEFSCYKNKDILKALCTIPHSPQTH